MLASTNPAAMRCADNWLCTVLLLLLRCTKTCFGFCMNCTFTAVAALKVKGPDSAFTMCRWRSPAAIKHLWQGLNAPKIATFKSMCAFSILATCYEDIWGNTHMAHAALFAIHGSLRLKFYCQGGSQQIAQLPCTLLKYFEWSCGENTSAWQFLAVGKTEAICVRTTASHPLAHRNMRQPCQRCRPGDRQQRGHPARAYS